MSDDKVSNDKDASSSSSSSSSSSFKSPFHFFPNLSTDILNFQKDCFSQFVDSFKPKEKSDSDSKQKKAEEDNFSKKDKKEDILLSHPFFKNIKDAYVSMSDHILEHMNNVIPTEYSEKDNVLFWIRNYLQAISPSNFFLTNPQVLEATFNEHGENLKRGFEQFIKDQQNPMAHGMPSQTQFEAFKVGENLATTEGSIIFENRFFQLIYYKPLTELVCERPLLIVPPWINKYYILDLSPQNSFVKWNLEQGRSVFLISWVNPDSTLKEVTLHDYLFEAIDKAVDFVLHTIKPLGIDTINLMGFCIGGVASLCLSSYYSKTQQKKLESLTLFATPVDFRYLREFQNLASPEQIKILENQMKYFGVISGQQIAQLFANMRAHDLIWANFINNYLLGKLPPKMEFLYWNSDPVNVPAKLHMEYLKDFLMRNAFYSKDYPYYVKGLSVDLRAIDVPVFSLGTRNDHIVPWKSAFAIKDFLPDTHFVLGGSGHIAGVINPPYKNKYGFWIDGNCDLNQKKEASHMDQFVEPPSVAKSWFETACKREGSFWIEWDRWMQSFDGELRKPIDPPYAIEEAPGRYVLAPLPPLLPLDMKLNNPFPFNFFK
jgi:polyhydroxyalkanoate synthase